MMEEFDFEYEVLSIHPDEDIRKIETIEPDTNSNLEQASDSDIIKTEAIETDANSGLEQALDYDSRKIEVIEIDTDSNLEQALDFDIEVIETDTNSNLEESLDSDVRKFENIEKDTNSNLEEASNSSKNKIEVVEIDADANLEQAFDSDSGEIVDDEEANDLEEGEIKDSNQVSKKKSDIACRFFKRGSCAFGSQCQYLHVSDTVYKMFDTNPPKRNDILPIPELHSFPKPPIFPPIVLPPRPFIAPQISVPPKTEFHRQGDTYEDTWEKGLEQARILIQQANLKKKSEEYEQKKLDSKNNKDEKSKEQYFTKAGLGNVLDFNSKKYGEKHSNISSFRKENTNDQKRSNFRYQPKSSDKWVDPWRRSKSPLSRKRRRSLSGSPPSRSRKHSSTSSTSSVSSCSSVFDDIYRPYQKKSPKGQQRFKSRSRSVSQSRRPKKRKLSPKYSFNGRRNPRSESRSLSVSSYRKRTLSSRARSRSSSSSTSSCSDCLKSSVVEEEKEMRRISAKLSEQMSHQSPKRVSESLESDCETSEMTVSSASCTSFTSDSEAESVLSTSSLRGKRSASRNNRSSYSNKTTNLSNTKVFNKNQSTSFKNQDLTHRKNDMVPEYQRKMQHSDNRKNLNNWHLKTGPSDYKPKNTTSYFSSVKKPTSASKFSDDKISSDKELLSAYQRQPSDNSKNVNSWSSKTEPTNCKPKNTGSYFSSVKKPPSVPKVSEDKISNDLELLSSYQRQPSDSSKNVNTWNCKTEPTNCKPKSTGSCFSSVKKPASATKASGSKLSADAELLFMYQGLGGSNKNSSVQKVKPNNPAAKQNRMRDDVNGTSKANGNSQPCNNVSKPSNTPKKNIVLNLQPKGKDYFNPELFNKPLHSDETVTIKKETASKREQLLTKLKLIDDAIARKKGK